MATNCLVTKLKGTVDNDSLPFFNTIKLSVGNAATQPGDNSMVVMALLGKSCVIKVNGNGSFGTTNGSYPYNSNNPYTLIGNDTLVTLYFSAGNYNIFITNKDNLYILRVNGGSGVSTISAVLDDLEYSTNLYHLRLINTVSRGDISMVSTFGVESFGALRVQGSPLIGGDISVLGIFPNIYEIYVNGSSISGSLESFVAAQAASGYTSRSESRPVEFEASFIQNLTFGGENRQIDVAQATWDSASKIALFNNVPASATTVFYSGYTVEEAAAKWPSISERIKVD